ncbi:MAG: hypothetical protein CME06_09370 [Gemmatimonadetes bacterium]|nr:hypothetical protein [Gemmatimonadota bacterium]
MKNADRQSERQESFVKAVTSKFGRRLGAAPDSRRDELLSEAVLFALQESGLDWDQAPRAAAVETVGGTLTVQTSNLNAPIRMEVSRTVIDSVINSGQSLLLRKAPESGDYLGAESVTRLGLQSILCVPIPHPTKRGRSVAAIYFDSREPLAFTVEDLSLLEEIAGLCAPAFLSLEPPCPSPDAELIKISKPFLNVIRAARRQHGAETAVLIGGEGGTGKTLLAQWLTEQGPRREKRCISIDCSRGDSIGQRLFGRVRGGMGTTTRRRGAIGIAAGGVLIMERIDLLTPDLQGRLLKALRDPAKNLLVVATESRSIPRLIESGHFSSELYAELGGRIFVLPPLRDRPEDLAAIAGSIIERSGYALEPALLKALAERSWPGNVRQLRYVLDEMLRDVAARDRDALVIEDLPPIDPLTEISVDAAPVFRGSVGEVALQQLRATMEELPVLPFKDVASVIYANALRRSDGNVSAAARSLALNRNTFYSRLDKAGVVLGRNNHRGDEE